MSLSVNRRFPSLAAVAIALALVLGAGSAAAEEVPPVPEASGWSRPFAVQGVVGFGTPVGYAGVMLEYSPHPVFVVSLGAGIGSGTANTDCLKSGYSGVCGGPFVDRLQLAAMGRLRVLRLRNSALTLGAGVSGGGYSWDEFTTDQPAHKSADRAYWANAEIGYEHRSRSGFSARGFLGFAGMLNPGALHCVDTGVNSDHCPTVHKNSGEWLSYMGGSVGWAF